MTEIKRCVFNNPRYSEIKKADDIEAGARLLRAFLESNYKASPAESVAFLSIQEGGAFFGMAKDSNGNIYNLDWDAAQRRSTIVFYDWYQANRDDLAKRKLEIPTKTASEVWGDLHVVVTNPMVSRQEMLAFAANAADRLNSASKAELGEIKRVDPETADAIQTVAAHREALRWYAKKSVSLEHDGKELTPSEVGYVVKVFPPQWTPSSTSMKVP